MTCHPDAVPIRRERWKDLASPTRALVCSAAAILFSAVCAQPDNSSRVHQLRTLKVVPIKAAGQSIKAWVMDSESKRAEGMMFLIDKDVRENQGMIFVFNEIQQAWGVDPATRRRVPYNAFWMHNCPLGLDIIYIDKNKRVLNVGDGKPQNDNQVPAKADYQWVLEMKRGWSKRHHLAPGDKVTIPPLKAEN